MTDPLAGAVAAVDALRGRDAWYAAQTHASLARYALEEGHEVAAAADVVEVGAPDPAGAGGGAGARDDARAVRRRALRDELGDLLLQVVLHARLAAEHEDGFDLADVAASLVAKAHRRHPHVFPADAPALGAAVPGSPVPDGPILDGPAAPRPTVAELEAGWEDLKDAERAGRDPLDDLPATLPALARAQKVLALAERAGLPLPTPVDEAPTPDAAPASVVTSAATVAASPAIGPALLALADAARRAGLDAEQELRASVRDLEDVLRAAPPPPPR